ncbi:MAG: thioredoxin TrxC [Gemmatimonadota bacterium]|nr:thioredoxin TrxC [Gemmatimonadota bacterium]
MDDHASPLATVPCPQCGRLNRVDLSRAADRPKCGSCQRPLLLDRPIKLSDETFDRVIAGSRVPVLVDFYADWCGPCKMMAPVLDEFADERAGRVLVTKLDTDRNRRVASQFSIRGIPTLIVFRNGQEVARETGAVGKQRLESLLVAAEANGDDAA